MGFGSSAVAGGKVDVWSTPPDFIEVSESYKQQASLKARVEILEFRISETEREVKRGSRKADVQEEAKEASKELRQELASIRSELARVQASIDFLLYHKEIFKAVTFANS